MTCHVTIIIRYGTRKPKDILLGKIDLVLGLLGRDVASHSYAQNTPLTQALNCKKLWGSDAFILKFSTGKVKETY